MGQHDAEVLSRLDAEPRAAAETWRARGSTFASAEPGSDDTTRASSQATHLRLLGAVIAHLARFVGLHSTGRHPAPLLLRGAVVVPATPTATTWRHLAGGA